ncbi:MAG: S8 family serine peptidase [Actinomycetota bacterium]|nr:S8 family serine peptidase [Actinomycetota bacterium]MDD5667934.1 S8 family serine peptidase [Actinomycetota bacterium]
MRCPLWSPRRSRRRCRALIAALALLAIASGAPAGMALAQVENPAPQLPILLLNGAIYSQEYEVGDLPESFRVEGYPSETTALYVVQCEGSIKEAWVEDLRRIGGDPRGYLPYNTLLASMDGDALSRLRELDFVAWHGVYQPYFKLSPALQLRLSQGGEVVILVELFSPLSLQETLGAMREIPVEVTGWQSDAWCGMIVLRAAVGDLAEVASLPAVEWMELCTAGTLPAAYAGAGDASAYATIHGQAAGGEAEKVAVMDTGIGNGGLQGIPAALEGSVASLVSLRGDGGADSSGHGTLVAASLLAAAARSASVPSPRLIVEAYATGYGMGCPPQPLSLYSLLEDAYERGARVLLSGSVPEGKESLGAYGIYAFQRDAFVWRNASMAIVEAAGNEGTDADGDGRVDAGSLLGGATAKNVLSMGGSESATPPQESGPLDYSQLESMFSGVFPAAPLREDSSVGEKPGMAAFSSRGPTRDGRIKPDLVAPATAVPLPLPQGAEAPGTVPSGTDGYVLAYGTSMAAANAAASLASMRLPLAEVLEAEPSAAMLKAFLVNGARELSPGQYGEEDLEISPSPNEVEGWGGLDLEAFRQVGSWVKVLDDREGMRLEESRVFRVEVTAGKELRITLAWSDYPSLPQARLHLVNDLDLRVIDPDGNAYYPNGRNSRDPLNNVERVVLDVSGKTGDYTIELKARNVPFAPQPFALVAQVY